LQGIENKTNTELKLQTPKHVALAKTEVLFDLKTKRPGCYIQPSFIYGLEQKTSSNRSGCDGNLAKLHYDSSTSVKTVVGGQ
jgi:uncharacterized FAD-dependent dehydrogenase